MILWYKRQQAKFPDTMAAGARGVLHHAIKAAETMSVITPMPPELLPLLIVQRVTDGGR